MSHKVLSRNAEKILMKKYLFILTSFLLVSYSWAEDFSAEQAMYLKQFIGQKNSTFAKNEDKNKCFTDKSAEVCSGAFFKLAKGTQIILTETNVQEIKEYSGGKLKVTRAYKRGPERESFTFVQEANGNSATFVVCPQTENLKDANGKKLVCYSAQKDVTVVSEAWINSKSGLEESSEKPSGPTPADQKALDTLFEKVSKDKNMDPDLGAPVVDKMEKYNKLSPGKQVIHDAKHSPGGPAPKRAPLPTVTDMMKKENEANAKLRNRIPPAQKVLPKTAQ
ncbi:MAG: hypothetical protein ACOYOK_10390 [Pseudobdellovibrionaceae bacterium]